MASEIEELRREVRRLHDHEEIRQLLYRYARGVDRADASIIKTVYAPGGTDQHGPFDGPGEEFAEVVAGLARKVWECVGNHHITNILIEFDDDDRARAEVYFLAFHPHADNGHPEMGIISGRYLDVLARADGRWGIERRVVISDWTRNHFGGDEWEKTTERSGYVGGRRGESDRSYSFFDRPSDQ